LPSEGADLDPANASTSVILLGVGERDFALPLGCVVEVVRMAALTPAPGAPGHVLGLLDLRGRVVPVIDLRLVLGLPAATPGLSTPICVVEAGGRAFGLIADAVADVHPLLAPVERLEVTPAGSPVAGVTHVGGRLVSVLDPEPLAEAGRVGTGS
jgi:purine-binding chemotaxis protein CheW